jgi:hypothetical protein
MQLRLSNREKAARFRLGARNLIPRGALTHPGAGLAPAGFHLGDAQRAMTLLADQLRAAPFEEIVRGAADRSRRSERAEALLAALAVVVQSPAQTNERQDRERENLQKVCDVWRSRMHRLTEISARQEHEQQGKRCLRPQEKLPFEPVELSVCRALIGMSARGDGKGDEEEEGHFDKKPLELVGKRVSHRMPTSIQNHTDGRGEHEKDEEHRQAERGSSLKGASPAITPEPERIANQSCREIGSRKRELRATCEMVFVPEF